MGRISALSVPQKCPEGSVWPDSDRVSTILIGGHPLAGAVEVVVVDVVAQRGPRHLQVQGDRALQTLTPQGPPEALDLAQRLRTNSA